MEKLKGGSEDGKPLQDIVESIYSCNGLVIPVEKVIWLVKSKGEGQFLD